MSSLLKNTLLTSVKKLTFNAEDVGWHLIKASARVKSKKQRGTVRRDSQQPIKLWSVILVFITSTLLIGGFLQRRLTESGSHKKQSEIIAEVRELMEEKMAIYQAGNLDYYGDHFKEPVFYVKIMKYAIQN
ncbi:MAG: hypothetical protein Q8P72_05765 [Candidatus Roizmanbacteria bacterium]|nr:hypothetical protein [Candidatus Roizmanbacteria bacterium]